MPVVGDKQEPADKSDFQEKKVPETCHKTK